MNTFAKPRFLALAAVAVISTFIGSWATTASGTFLGNGASRTRDCTSTICSNRLWLRAPVLRVRTR